MSQRPIHQCQCEICQSPQPHADKEDHHRMNVLLSRLNEQIDAGNVVYVTL